MGEPTQAEQYLLDQVRRGSQEAWAQLVERYQGRLISFARRRLAPGADPEDLVQETFMRFLRGLKDFRGQASVETYLFMILRRQLIEVFRGRKAGSVRLNGPAAYGGGSGSGAGELAVEPTSPSDTPSGYAQRDERRHAARAALTTALRGLVGSLQAELNFRDLQVLEMVFYAQRPNRDIAAALGVRPEHVALVKHRWLKQARERVIPLYRHHLGDRHDQEPPDAAALDSLLTELWEDERLSCPKRSTIAGYLLRTLDDPWQQYVEFHLNTLGCASCQANLDDLQKQTAQDRRALRDRILQSTVGFFRKT